MADTGITVETLKTQLAAVEAAITDILTTGQSYVRPGLSLTRADLKGLQDREQYLIRSIQRAEDGIIAVSEVAGSTSGSAGNQWTDPEAP